MMKTTKIKTTRKTSDLLRDLANAREHSAWPRFLSLATRHTCGPETLLGAWTWFQRGCDAPIWNARDQRPPPPGTSVTIVITNEPSGEILAEDLLVQADDEADEHFVARAAVVLEFLRARSTPTPVLARNLDDDFTPREA